MLSFLTHEYFNFFFTSRKETIDHFHPQKFWIIQNDLVSFYIGAKYLNKDLFGG